MKVTFKLHPKATGLAAVGYSKRGADIKIKGKKVGRINPPSWTSEYYTIQFSVVKDDIMEDGNSNCIWRNITLNAKFNDLENAQKFIIENIHLIVKKYTLHAVE